MTSNTAIMEPNGTPTWADRDVVRRIHGPSKCVDNFAAGTPELCSCKGKSHAAQAFVRDARIIAEARLEAFEAGRAFERASVVEFARKENYGSSMRTFIKKIFRGYHDCGHGEPK